MTSQPFEDPLGHVALLPGVGDAVERSRAAVDALRGHRVLRRSAGRVAAESALRAARASAALDGTDVPLEDLRRTLEADQLDGVVRGALRVSAELGPLRRTWDRAPRQAIARLHTLAAAGRAPERDLGRPGAAAAPRLAGLAALLSDPTAAPALVVAAVAHAELATMGAFAVGGGVVARAAGRLTLVSRGLDPGGLSVPEVGHVELGLAAYEDHLCGYREGSSDGSDGIAAWVTYCAEAVVLGAREGVAICEAIRRGD